MYPFSCSARCPFVYVQSQLDILPVLPLESLHMGPGLLHQARKLLLHPSGNLRKRSQPVRFPMYDRKVYPSPFSSAELLLTE
jgi:hypothetical protein